MQHKQQRAGIRRMRERAGLSKAALARSIGINRALYAAFEAGRMELTQSQYRALATLFDPATVQAVVEPKKPEKRPASIASKLKSNGTSGGAKGCVNPPSDPLQDLQGIVARENCDFSFLQRAISKASAKLETLSAIQLSNLVRAFKIDIYGGTCTTTNEKVALPDVRAAILCSLAIGPRWEHFDRAELYELVLEMRKLLPEAGKLVPFLSILEEMLESKAQKGINTSRLRLQSSKYVIQCFMAGFQLPSLREISN